MPIQVNHVKEIVFGAGSLNNLGTVVKKLGGKKVLTVIDPFLKDSIGNRLVDLLKAAGIEAELYSEITPEPGLEIADACAAQVVKFKADLVIGLGGGSAMDVAKAAAMLATNGGQAESYVGVDTVKKPGLPTIMIPTTAGTGSEVSLTAVFINKKTKTKGGMNSDFLYPNVALLDPELTLSVPPRVTAYTGIDALTHAIESYVSRRSNVISRMYAFQGLSLISQNLRTAYFNGNDLNARSEMLLGSLMAGISLANAGVGAVHGLSYPLGGEYGVPHGLANSLLLPAVMEFNAPAALDLFAEIAEGLGVDTCGMSTREAAFASVDAIHELYEDLDWTDRLSDFNVPESALPAMAEGILVKMKRVFDNNPRPVTVEDAMSIYEQSF